MAVGKFGAGSAFGFVDGYNLISQKITGLREKHISPTEDVTGLGDARSVENFPRHRKRRLVLCAWGLQVIPRAIPLSGTRGRSPMSMKC